MNVCWEASEKRRGKGFFFFNRGIFYWEIFYRENFCNGLKEKDKSHFVFLAVIQLSNMLCEVRE